ncbi:MAG TPA: M1 family aminopeptidase [Geobacteraceae bacterium]|nr:M1 family aminopeptidase [Geobacteraceae bacterium]
MKKLLIIAIATFTVLSGTLTGAAAGESRGTLVSQEIAVTLVPAEHLLRGESILSYDSSPGTLALSLDPSARIDGVSSAGKALAYTFIDGRLTVTAAAGGPLSISIRYLLIQNDPLPGATAGGEDPHYGVNGSISPQGVFLGTGAVWYPRSATAPLRRTIRISAPVGMEGITAGERLSRETSDGVSRSVWQEEPPVGNLALAAGPYQIKERRLAGILVSTYLYPENAHLADVYLEAASGYVSFFAELFGPYPFPKFAVVENFFPTGYGFPSFTLLGSTVIRLPFITTTSLPHEIAHSWWGNGVQVNTDRGNWCEGLVTYLADHLLEERKGGAAGRDYRLRLLTDFSLLVPDQQGFPLTGFSSRVDPASRAIGYGKGAMLWHMLRRRVGDEAFFAALREVYRTRRYQSASWSDFSRALAASSGQNLEPFMTPWLERPGGPHLSLADVASQRKGGRWLVTGRVIQTPPLFPLFLPLRLETADSSFDQTLQLTGERNSFHFLTDSPPRRLLLDPDVDVFRLLHANQLPANVNRLKGSRRLLAVITPGCGAGVAPLRQLLQSLGQEGSRIVTEDELATGVGRDHDLIFCGVPKKADELFELPPGLELGRGSFSVNSERFSGDGDLLFLVTRQVANQGLVSALFLPLSPGAAESGLQKISHYGNYATLAFSGGINRHKGRAPQQPAADRVVFPGEKQP